MLQLEDWTKVYEQQTVLNGLNLKLEVGQVGVIVGPSGSGKSTLLRSINFLSPADSGRLQFGNFQKTVSQFTQGDILWLRRQTAMVFQSYALFSKKTALENVMEHLLLVKHLDFKTAKNKALEYLERVGLAHYGEAYPHQLSGGQQQRVGLARAIAAEPKLLLLDEPTSALDPTNVQEVLDLILQIPMTNRSMLLVTHELDFARQIADIVMKMKDGQIIAVGPPDKIIPKK